MINKEKKSSQQWVDILTSRISDENKSVIEKYLTELPIKILTLTKELRVPVYTPYIDTSLDGWIEYKNNDFIIYLNTDYPKTRQVFTLAHELSHYLLHRDKIVKEGQLDRGYVKSGYFDKEEWQANLYASELLMPTGILNSVITENIEYLREDNLAKYLQNTCLVSSVVALKRARRAIKHFKKINDL